MPPPAFAAGGCRAKLMGGYPYQLKAGSPVRCARSTRPTSGEAAPELEVSLGEGATLLGLLGPLRRSPVGGHQFGQAGSGGPHAGGKPRIAIRALRPELRLANCNRNAHLTLRRVEPIRSPSTSATGNLSLGTARWCARGHQRAPACDHATLRGARAKYRASLGGVKHSPLSHRVPYPGQSPDVLRGIPLDNHQVGLGSDLHASEGLRGRNEARGGCGGQRA
jgi:hypothetical protein